MKKLLLRFLGMALLLAALQSCSWFDEARGVAEVVSVHTAEDDAYRYCYADVKITNVGKCDIYTSNISVQAASNKGMYFKSAELATTIRPGNSIFITLEFTIPLTKEERQTVTTTTSTSSTDSNGNSNTNGTSSSSSTSSNSHSTTTSTSTSTTTLGSGNIDPEREVWNTDTVQIVGNFFD